MKVVKSTHVGSYGFIIQDEKVALIKKARGGYKGLLDIPGGGIEHDETPVDALKRELMEEAGVTVTKYKMITATSRTFQWQMEKDVIEDLHHIGILYQVEVLEDTVKEESDGIDSNGCNYYEIEKLHKKNLTPFAIEGLELLGYSIKD
jgi:8-oxo-dGTP pyrophosphatase MutT (NUDIX family)